MLEEGVPVGKYRFVAKSSTGRWFAVIARILWSSGRALCQNLERWVKMGYLLGTSSEWVGAEGSP